MSWQGVGTQKSLSYVVADVAEDDIQFFEFKGSEGHVKVHYRISKKQLPGTFELSYAKTRMSSKLQGYLAHITKFLLYLSMSILLWIALLTMEGNKI